MELLGMAQDNERIYVLVNNFNGAIVESTHKFLPQWFARGFEVIEVKMASILEEE